MNSSTRKPLILLLSITLIAATGFWTASTRAAQTASHALPDTPGVTAACPGDDGTDPAHWSWHGIDIQNLGFFQEQHGSNVGRIMIELGKAYRSKEGLKTVPFKVVAIGGTGYAPGIGETSFTLDSSRPVEGAIWEKVPGSEFPAIQEMRFHFFYTVEALPGKVLRSRNPAVMRSENVLAFPPPPGTEYKLVAPIELEEVGKPGVVVASVVGNRVQI